MPSRLSLFSFAFAGFALVVAPRAASADRLQNTLNAQRLAFEAGQARWNSYSQRERQLVRAMERESSNFFTATGRSCVLRTRPALSFLLTAIEMEAGEEPFVQRWLENHCQFDSLHDTVSRLARDTEQQFGISSGSPSDPTDEWWNLLDAPQRRLIEAVDREVAAHAQTAGRRCVPPEHADAFFDRIDAAIRAVPERERTTAVYRMLMYCR